MIAKLLIFVSSTSELAAERAALRESLPRDIYDLYLFEEDRARGQSPEQRCRQMIEQSDAFVALLGPHYGSPFPGDPLGRSICEWEFETVRGAHAAEIMAFVKALPPGDGPEPRQRTFVERVRDFCRGHWCVEYTGVAELVDKVRSGLEHWLAERAIAVAEREPGLLRWLNRLLLPVAGGSVLLLLGLAVFAALSPDVITTRAMLGVSASCICLLLFCILLQRIAVGGHHA